VRTVATACALVLAIHLALMMAWPALHPGFAALFRLGVRAAAAPIAAAAKTDLRVDAGRDAFDTEIRAQNRTTGRVAVMQVDSRLIGYLPNAMLVALAVATPVAWRQRGRILVLGLALVNACIALRIAIRTLLLLRTVDAVAVGPRIAGALARIEETFGIGTSGSFVIPVCIWILVVAGSWNALRTTRLRPQPRL
jgi:hypothetical protein